MEDMAKFINGKYEDDKRWGYRSTVKALMKNGYSFSASKALVRESPMFEMINMIGHTMLNDTTPEENADWVVKWHNRSEQDKKDTMEYLRGAYLA